MGGSSWGQAACSQDPGFQGAAVSCEYRGKEGVRDESPGVGKGLPKTSSEWAHVRSAGQVPSLVPLCLCVCEREREEWGWKWGMHIFKEEAVGTGLFFLRYKHILCSTP